jgi:hypothetical protein
MALNHYFNNTRAFNEQNLVEDLVIETIKIHGVEVYYLPRTTVNKDTIFGEDPLSSFTSSRPIEMYLETVNGFEGDRDLISKFGLEIRDSATFVVSKLRFQKETEFTRPKEGDLLYFPLTKGFFEIKFVEHESPFYQLGKNYTFKLSVELFQYSSETVTTGESEIDDIVGTKAYNIYLGYSNLVGAFSVGDSVFQYTNGTITGSATGANCTALVVAINGSTITLKSPVGSWKATNTTTNRYVTKSNTTYAKVTSVSDTVDTDTYDDNLAIQTKANTVLDFSETNPFGEL